MGTNLKKKHTLALIWTQYTLLLYMLVVPDWKKTLLFLYHGRIDNDTIKRIHEKGGRFWGSYRLMKFINKQTHNIVYCLCRFVSDRLIKPLLYLWLRIEGEENVHVYGYEHVFGAVTCLDAGCEFTVIEDGMSSYNSRQKTEKFWQAYHSSDARPEKYLSGGWSDAVQNVILTGRLPTPKGLEEKVNVVNMKQLWQNLSVNKKQELCYIFDFNIEKWQEIINDGRDILFLSQPLSPVWMDEADEIILLRELLSKYDMKKVIIKVHPADKKRYEDIFSQCLVIRLTLPVEFLWLEDLPFKKVVGVFSTALYGTWSNDRLDIRPDLLQKYARQELKD